MWGLNFFFQIAQLLIDSISEFRFGWKLILRTQVLLNSFKLLHCLHCF